MIILIDAQKTFDKVQHAFMIKIIESVGMEEAYCNIIKTMYMYVCLYMCIYTYMNMHEYMCMYINIFTCMYVFISQQSAFILNTEKVRATQLK